MSKHITLDYIQDWIYKHDCKTKIISNQYVNNLTDITMVCECGNTFTSTWKRMKQIDKCRCNQCGEIKRTHMRTSMTSVKNELLIYGYTLIDDNFNNIHSINIKDFNNYKYNADLFRLRQRKRCMPFSRYNPFLFDNIEQYIKSNHIESHLLEVNISKDISVKLKCSCGNIFGTTLDSLLHQNKFRCNKCSRSESLLEKKVENYLISKDIKYIYQKTFNDCKNIRKLKFDFYLTKYNCVIEVNGQQHYYEQSNFTMSLKEQKERDLLKKQYCENHNINYIAIAFWKINNSNKYKEIINKILE